MIELNDKVDYFREKYDSMKELLASCKLQLKEFEELNLLRNDVIEKLETENITMKNLIQQQQQQNTTSSTLNSVRNNYNEMSMMQQTPGKYTDKSFSLNMQQVDCENSRFQDNQRACNDGTRQNLYMSEKKNYFNNRLNINTYESNNPKRQGLLSVGITPKASDLLDKNNSQSYIQMTVSRRHQLDYEREHDVERSQLIPPSNNESMIVSKQKQKITR